MSSQKILREECYVGDIPFSFVYPKASKHQKIIFFFHGFQSNRFLGPMNREYRLAEMGYTVILLDAYWHGERKNPAFEKLPPDQKHFRMVDIEIQTAMDAMTVYQYLMEQKRISPTADVASYGVSMGGATAFYLATIFPKLKVLVALVASPSFYDYLIDKEEQMGWIMDEQIRDKMDEYRQIEAMNHPELFLDKKLWFGVGVEDNVVPKKYAEAFSKKIHCEYHEYPVGHCSNEDMLEDAYHFLKQNL